MKTRIKLGCITITSPLTVLFWIVVCIILYYAFTGYVMLGPRF